MAPIYLDSSAICKLVLAEDESAALLRWLEQRPERIASVLAKVETRRAARRAGVRGVMLRAEAVLARIALLEIDREIVERASIMPPEDLRSLDAIHLAAALPVPGLSEFVTYDRRLAEAAGSAGLLVVSPA